MQIFMENHDILSTNITKKQKNRLQLQLYIKHLILTALTHIKYQDCLL